MSIVPEWLLPTRHMALAAALLLVGTAGPACTGTCRALTDEARALVDSTSTCSAGDQCIVIAVPDYAGANNCVAPLQGLAAVRPDAGLEAFGDRAKALVRDFKAGCSECASAGSPNPAEYVAQCNASTSRCELVRR